MSRILIIGYGNSMRGDDAIGWQAAHELEQRFHGDSEVEVIAAHQLAPEMAEDVSRSEFVLFLDASAGERPGTIKRIATFPEAAAFDFAHHLTPAGLLAAAEQLYGDVPQAICITLAGWSFELGQPISQGARSRMPELLRLAEQEIATYRIRTQAGRVAGVK